MTTAGSSNGRTSDSCSENGCSIQSPATTDGKLERLSATMRELNERHAKALEKRGPFMAELELDSVSFVAALPIESFAKLYPEKFAELFPEKAGALT